MISYGGVLLLVGAAALATPNTGWAQRGGGGHGGGAHFGGAHFGGAHVGGARFGGGHIGGARVGGYRGGVYGNAYRFGGSRAYYHPNYLYGGYGFYPYYGFYGAYPYSYDTYPYASSGIDYGSGYTGLYSGDPLSDPSLYAFTNPPATGYQAYYPPATAATTPDLPAHLNVTVPADAQVWFNDKLMKTTGPTREFASPPLTPGIPYTYKVRARWTENGHEMTQRQQVQVAAGAHVNVTFPLPAKAAAQTSALK
jgi:uncharacterized protein (TIGR03000 family)